MGASGNVRLIVAGVVSLALIGAVVYMSQSANPNTGTMIMLLSSTLSGVLAYLKAGKIQANMATRTTQLDVAEKVNGNYARSETIAREALSALPPTQGREILRRVDQDPPKDLG